MPGFLRQSTSSQARALGPFVDDSDFKTTKTGLTIANTDIKLVANGGASANKNSGGGTHRANGVYGVTFDATDTATVGELEVSVVVSGALPVFDKFIVLEEVVYDALFAASAPGYGTAQSGDAYAIVNSGTYGNSALKALIDAIDDYVDTEVAAIKAKTDNLPSDPADASVIATATTAILDAIALLPDADLNAATLLDFTNGVEGSLTVKQALRGMVAVLLGKASGLDGTTAVYRNSSDSKDRVTATVDSDGNRTSVTLDLS